MESRVRELALFNLGIDSKLRGCDLVALKVRDICHGDQVASRATVMQHKTYHPVQFELTATTREALQQWIKTTELKSEDYIFPSRLHKSPHLWKGQHARIVDRRVVELGLDPAEYGTHFMQRTKATLIYRRTKNLLQSSYYCGTPKSSQLFATLALRSTTLWSFQSKRKSETSNCLSSSVVGG